MQRGQEMMIQKMLSSIPGVKNNPLVLNALQMAQRGDVNSLRNMAENIAREKGINIQEIARQYGIKL